MTDTFANKDVVVLAVTENPVYLQTETGKAVRTLTALDLGGGGSGSGGDASATNQVLEIAALNGLASKDDPTIRMTFDTIEHGLTLALDVAGWNTFFGIDAVVSMSIDGATITLVLSKKVSLTNGFSYEGDPEASWLLRWEDNCVLLNGNIYGTTAVTHAETSASNLTNFLNSLLSLEYIKADNAVLWDYGLLYCTCNNVLSFPNLKIMRNSGISSTLNVLDLPELTTALDCFIPNGSQPPTTINMLLVPKLVKINNTTFTGCTINYITINATLSANADYIAAKAAYFPNVVETIVPDHTLIANTLLQSISTKTRQALAVLSTQVVTIGATSSVSSGVSSTTNRISLISTVNCWIKVADTTPTASIGGTDCFYLAAGVPFYPIDVTPSVTRVAVIGLDPTAGHLSIVSSS